MTQLVITRFEQLSTSSAADLRLAKVVLKGQIMLFLKSFE